MQMGPDKMRTLAERVVRACGFLSAQHMVINTRTAISGRLARSGLALGHCSAANSRFSAIRWRVPGLSIDGKGARRRQQLAGAPPKPASTSLRVETTPGGSSLTGVP